jgi:dolichol-phosphate mannosyltransferase
MPAYNEARLVRTAIRSVPRFVDWIVVVDDASADGTVDVVQQCNDERVVLVCHVRNRGAGAAIQSGYRRALALGADICVVMAADAQMDPRDLPRLVEPIAYHRADYVKGDRLSHPSVLGEMPWVRWFANHVLSALTTLALGTRVRDSQCGYTAMARSMCARVVTEALWPRYGYPNDLLGMLVAYRARIGHVTVRPVYGDESSGVRLRDAIVVVPFLLARIAWRRVLAATTPSLWSNASAHDAIYEPRRAYYELPDVGR